MRSVDKVAFGKRVAKRRAMFFSSAEALAAAVGMKQQGINSIERGKVARPGKLREIAIALRTTEEWLLWEEGPENFKPDRLRPAAGNSAECLAFQKTWSKANSSERRIITKVAEIIVRNRTA